MLIPGEKEEELHALRDGWLADYDPPTETALTLVLETVKEYWFQLRNERYYNKTLYSLPEDLTQWSEPQHKAVERAHRYLTAAHRRFHRAFQDLEHYYKIHGYQKPKSGTGSQFSERNAPESKPTPIPEIRCLSPVAPSQTPPKQNFFTGRDAPKNRRKIPLLDQWVEISSDENGNTVTQLYPSNEELIEEGHRMDPPPELVYRRLHFYGGIPPEYFWATSSPELRDSGGMATQRMTVDTWLETIEREKQSGTGHVGRCRKPLPRPKEHGECNCPTCTRLYAQMELRNPEC